MISVGPAGSFDGLRKHVNLSDRLALLSTYRRCHHHHHHRHHHHHHHCRLIMALLIQQRAVHLIRKAFRGSSPRVSFATMKDNSLTLHHRTWVVLHNTMCGTLQIRCEVMIYMHLIQDIRILRFFLTESHSLLDQ